MTAGELAERTADAYAVKLYSSWRACCRALLSRYTARSAEAILRSKFPRWAADYSSARYGRATSRDLVRYLDSVKAAAVGNATRALLMELERFEAKP